MKTFIRRVGLIFFKCKDRKEIKTQKVVKKNKLTLTRRNHYNNVYSTLFINLSKSVSLISESDNFSL